MIDDVIQSTDDDDDIKTTDDDEPDDETKEEQETPKPGILTYIISIYFAEYISVFELECSLLLIYWV